MGRAGPSMTGLTGLGGAEWGKAGLGGVGSGKCVTSREPHV